MKMRLTAQNNFLFQKHLFRTLAKRNFLWKIMTIHASNQRKEGRLNGEKLFAEFSLKIDR